MSGGVTDEDFATYVSQTGKATPEQLEAARKTQAESSKQGAPLSLAEALVQQGVLTAAAREGIEIELHDQQAGGPPQPGPDELGRRPGEDAAGSAAGASPPPRDSVAAKPPGTGPQKPVDAPAESKEPAPRARGRKTLYLVLGGIACAAVLAAVGFALSRLGMLETTTDDAASAAAKDLAARTDLSKITPLRPGAVDLLPMINPETAANGRWVLKDGALVSDRTYETSIRIPWELPEEYDLRVEFTRLEGNEWIRQTLCAAGRTFHWVIACGGNTKYTFFPFAGGYWDNNKTTLTVPACLENGRGYVSVVRVRKGSVSASLNGRQVRYCGSKDYQNIGEPLKPGEPAVLALATWGSPTAFHSIQVLEVTGKGKPVELPWTKPATVDEAFIKAVGAMWPDEQLQQITPKLQAFNPGFDGVVQPTTYAGSLVGLGLLARNIQNLTPLGAFPRLTNLACADGGGRSYVLWDLSPLKGMGLVNADFTNTNVADLSPLKEMKLQNLCVRGTPLADLSPLAGMPLASLDCAWTFVSNLAPLRGMALKGLICNNTRVRHLTPLKGMPLTVLDCSGTLIRDVAPLAGAPLVCLRFSGSPVRDLGPLAGMPLTELRIQNTPVSDLSLLTGMRLARLSCGLTAISDVSPLAGMPLTELDLQGTQVKDLGPLKGMQLRTLNINTMPVSDLSPLAGMPLTWLDIHSTKVADLSPLKGMPLTWLDVRGIQATDFSALKDLPLTDLGIDLKPERDTAILRLVKTLGRINGQGAADVLKTGK
ncbi:MAG: hypothetical protein NTW87_27590 [Planctomycetota bacterium]|nr:hypothetical protein [Planctomycetota bacterium]